MSGRLPAAAAVIGLSHRTNSHHRGRAFKGALCRPDRPLEETITRGSNRPMTKLLGFVGATVGGYVGWAIGAFAGPFTAFMVSMVGTGVGMYYGRRIGQNIGA